MAETRAVINVDINTSPAAAALRSLQGQLNSFTTALNRNNAEQALASKGIQRQLMSLVNTSKFFTAEMVRMETGASQLDKTLSKGQATMSQFFSAKFRKDGLEASRVLSLAHARASALQTQFVATAGAANGFRDAIAIRPLHAFNAEAAVSAERLIIQRAMLQQATTSMINFGKNTQWAGRQLMVGFTVPLTIFAATAGKTFMDIEKQAISFKKVYGDAFTTPEELEKNIDAVKQLASEFTKYGIAVSDTMGLAAQAAAAGAKNADLIDATTEATRLATLGQLDQQKALETTIALQSAFGLSGEKLAKSINFMNMVENQTVLTLQDLTDAIPRVAPVIQGLGGSVEDMTIMLTAMKEGGVTAAQGANALKSGLASLINPTDRAVEKLQKMGIGLNSIVQTNRGDLMATIQDFAKALQTLDEFERQQALETVFGKFQYARLGALFNNIVKDGSQASRAMDAAAMSAEGLAATANKELGMIEESAATKFTAAMEKLKLAIAPIGEMFVKMATPILNFLSMIAEKFNQLPDFAKNFAALGTVIVGIVIPAGTMFLGLLMNLIGTLTKFGHLSTVFVKGFAQGGIRKAIENVTQATRYMSLSEIDATNAARQLGGATEAVNQALLEQIGPTELATSAIAGLAGAYDVLAQNMREAALIGGLPMQVPGASMMRAGNQGSMLYRPLPIVARNKGGSIPYLSGGGRPTVPGMGNTDTVPAMLTPGEFVVNKKATEQNLGLLHAINSGDVQYRNMGGGIAEAGRKFYGMRPNPFSTAAQAALLRQQQYESARGNIANIFGVPAGVSVSRSTNQSATQIASAKTRSQGIYQVLSKQQTKGADLIRQAVNLGLSPEELGLKAIGNFIVAMSPKANMAMARGSLTRSSLLGELGSNSVYAPIATQIQRYFGKSFNYDAFDSIYRDQISKLPAAGITNQRFEKASRNALRIYMEQQGYAKNQRKDFLRDILSGDTVRANVPVAKIRNMLSRNSIPFTESGADIYANINGKTYNFGDLAGRGIGYLGRSEGIFRYDKIDMPEGVARVHANKGGMIPGVQYLQTGARVAAMSKSLIKQMISGITTDGRGSPYAYKILKSSLGTEIDSRILIDAQKLGGYDKKPIMPGWYSRIATAHIRPERRGFKKLWRARNIRFTSAAENHIMNQVFPNASKEKKELLSDIARKNKLTKFYKSLLNGNHPTTVDEYRKLDILLSELRKDKRFKDVFNNEFDDADTALLSGLAKFRYDKSKKVQGYISQYEDPFNLVKGRAQTARTLISNMNMGGQILGGTVNKNKNFYGRFNAKTVELFTKWVSSQPSAISEMKIGVAEDAALAQMFKGGFRKSGQAETLERATWMENIPKLGSTIPLGSLASFSPKGTPVTQHLMNSQLRKDYESAMMFLKMDQKTQKQDAYFLRKVMQAGPDNVPSWSPEHRYISPITKNKGIDAWVEDTVKFMSDRKRQIKKHKEVIRNYHRMIPTVVELETPKGTIRANVDDIVALQNQKFMGRQTTEQERILHNAMIKVLGIEEEGNLKRVKAKLISSEYPGFNSGGIIPKMQYFGANMLQRVVQPMMAAKTAAQQQEFLTLYSGGNFEKGFALNPIKTRANTTNLHGPGVYTTEAKNMAETYVVNRGNNDRHLYEIKIGKGTRKFLDLDQEYIDAPTFKIEMAMEKVLKKHGMTYEDVMPLRTGSMTVAQWRESITENIASKLKTRGMSRDDAEWEGQMAFVNAARESGISGLTHVGGKLMGKNEQLHRVYILYDKPDSMLRLNQGGFLSPTLRANRGNIVPGAGNTDTVPAMLTPGEFVVNKRATQQNIDILHAINNGNVPGYALGGQVRSINSGQLDRNGKPIRYYQAKMPDGSRQYFATRAEANSAIKSARPPGMMGMGKMNVSMGLGMGGMGIMMIGQKMESDAMQRGTTSAMGSALSMGGLGLSIASILPMMGKFGIALGAVAAVVGPIAVSLKIFRENIDKAAQESLKLGQNTGGTANRMEELSAATGYQFSITRAQDRIFRFTEQEKQNAQQFVGYFESEGGQKFINDLKSLTSNDRYEKVASIIAQGIADGMDEETAKAYGNAIAAYVNDGMLRSRLIQDFRRGKFKSGPQALVDLVVKRQEDSQAAIDKLAGKTGYSSVAGGPLGNTAEGIRNKQVGLGAIGGIGGAIGGGVIGGAIAGAAAGSVVPVIGTLIGAAIGTAIGLGAAWLLNKSAVQQLEQNTRLAGVSLGSSLESLKEIANAEAAISEARLNGTMKAQEAEIELAKLRKTEAAAATNVKNAVEAMATGSVDTDAMGLALKNSLLLNANFDEAKAQAVVDSTAFNTVATQLFSNIDPEEIKTNPEYKKQKEVVLGVITETLTGITPENAAQKIADIEQIYATVQNQLVSAAADGLTPDELRTIASARGLSNVFSTAWKGLIDEVIPPTVTKGKLIEMLTGRAAGIFGEGTIGGEKRRRGGYLGTTISNVNLEEVSSTQNQKTLRDIETGTKIIGETQAKAASELGKIFTEGVLRAAPGGYKSFEELLLNANEGGDYEKAQVLSTIAGVAESPEQFASLLSQMMLVNEEFASFINSSEGMSSLSYNLQNLGIDAEQFAIDLKIINAGLDAGIANPKIIKIDTPIEKAQKAIEDWYNKSKPQLEAMGITADILNSNLLAISDPALITRLGAVGALGDQARMNYAKLIQLLPKGLDVNAVAAAYPDALTDAKTVANELQQALEDIDKIEFKKFGKNWKEVKTAIGRIDKTTFANLAINVGYAREEIAPLFEDIVSGYDSVADSIAKTKGLVSKETGNVKTGKLTGQIVQEVYFSMYGKNFDNPNQLAKDIQSYFPSQLSPIMLPIIMAVMEAGISPAEFGAAMKDQKTFKGQTTVSDAVTRRYGIGPETVTTTQVVGQQAVDYAAWANSISSMFSGAAGTGPGGGGGGGGEKSIIEQLKEQFKMLKDIFDGMSKFVKSKTGEFKGIIAGPFGPEFIEYLKSQGEQGVKLLKEGGEKLKEAYNEFKKVQTQEATNFAQTFPATLIRRTKDIRIESQFRGKLARKGFDQDTQDQFIEGIGGVEGIRRYNELVNKRNELKAKGKDLSKEELDQLKAINQAMSLGGPAAKQLFATMTKKEVTDNLKEMRKETKDLSYLLSLGYSKEEADALLQMGVNSSMTAGEIANLSTELQNLAAKTANLLELQMNYASIQGQQLANQEEIRQLEYEIKLIEEINKDEKMAALYAKEGVSNHEDLLAIYERQASMKARELELEQRKLEPIDEQIKNIEEQIDKTEKSYEAQIEALDKILEAESEIYAIRERTLNLADALSRGDVAAAAQAALDLERERASQRATDQRSLLEQQRQQSIKSLEDQITTQKDKRKLVEAEITRLQKEQRSIADQLYNVQFIINEQAFRLQNTYGLGNNALAELRNKLEIARLEQTRLADEAKRAADELERAKRAQGGATTPTPAPAPSGGTTGGGGLVQTPAGTMILPGFGIIAVPSTPKPAPQAPAWSQPGYWSGVFGINKPPGFAYGGKVSYKGSREPAPGFAMGGKVKYFANGGRSFGSDTVPAMLTPGEFVVRRSMAKAYGPLLESINSNVFPRVNMNRAIPSSSAQKSGSMYNYNVNVTLNGSDMDPNDVANVVMQKIKMKENMNVRNYNYRG